MSELNGLQEENELLKQKISSIEETLLLYKNTFYDLIKQIQDIGKAISDSHEMNIQEHAFMKSLENNLPFEIGDPRQLESVFFFPIIVDAKTSIQEMIDNKKSMARFGDGEFAIICGHNRQPFQKVDEQLGKRLKQVLQSEISNLMIGIADNYGNLEKFTEFAANGIRLYMQDSVRREHMQLLSRDKVYYDAYLSRPYVMLRDKFTDAPRKRFDHLKQIWKDRNVIMIEGEQTRLGVGNDLFDGCQSIRRILAPAKNSYDRYSEILDSALRAACTDDLFLIATGPCAAVFAYDLTLEGHQAIDIGHVDVEYEWLLKGTGEREPITNKYTNEIPGQEEAEDIKDPVYESQIIDAYL